MDDMSELSEEEFLKAALSIECSAVGSFSNQHSFNIPTDNCQRTDTTTVKHRAKESSGKSSFSIFMDSDDSDLDLDLGIEKSDVELQESNNQVLRQFSKSSVGNLSVTMAPIAEKNLTTSLRSSRENAFGAKNTATVSTLPMVTETLTILNSSASASNSMEAGKSMEKKDLKFAFPSTPSDHLSVMPISAETRRKRKFPGPAGILQRFATGVDFSCSQSAETYFSSAAWLMMKDDLGVHADLIMNAYNTVSIIKKANAKLLPKGKVPVFCAVIEEVKVYSADASVALRDLSGVIFGTMHRQLLKDHMQEIQAGTIVVLRQVGVLCPSGRRNCYLNITPNNVVGFYFNQDATEAVKVAVKDLTEDDFEMLLKEPSKSQSSIVPKTCPLNKSSANEPTFANKSSRLFDDGANSTPYQSKPVLAFTKTAPAVSSRPRFHSSSTDNFSNTSRFVEANSLTPVSAKQQNFTISKSNSFSPTTPRMMSFETRPALRQVPPYSRPLTVPDRPSSLTLNVSVVSSRLSNVCQPSELLLAKENVSACSSQSKAFHFKQFSSGKSLPATGYEVARCVTAPTVSIVPEKNEWHNFEYIDDSVLSDLSNDFFADL